MELTDHDEDRLFGSENGPDFIAAINAGDLKLAVAMLRTMDSVTPSQIAELANILSDEVSLSLDYPHKLILARRQRGKPRNIRRERASDGVTALILQQNLQKFPKLEAALQQTADEIGASVSTVKARVRRARKRRSPKPDLSDPSSA